MNRMEPGLAEGLRREQALTLLLWVSRVPPSVLPPPRGSMVLTLLCPHR